MKAAGRVWKCGCWSASSKTTGFGECNATCQAAIRPYRKTETITDYVRLCSDIMAGHKDVAMAIALQGKNCTSFVSIDWKRGKLMAFWKLF